MHKTNIYYGVGTYEQSDRKRPVAKRALYLDLDSKDFGSKAGALQELAAFLRATGVVPPSIYVDSGRGIHVYWCFDRDLDVASWRTLAGRLKESCASAGFRADPPVTADAARILRVPGTLNHKESPALSCRVLKDTGVSYDPGSILPVRNANVPAHLAALGAAVGADDLDYAPGSASYPAVPYYGTEIARKCGVMAEAVATGGKDHSEPNWRHLLSLLTFCEDGKELIHAISDKHPGYNADATEKKFAQVMQLKLDGKLKPILCSTFASYKGSICAACPFNGNIKTPMILGKLEATQYLPGNYRMSDFSIERLVKKGDAENPEVWHTAFPYRIVDVEVFDHGRGKGKQIQFTCVSKRETVKIDLDSFVLHGQGDGLMQALNGAGLWIQAEQLTEFKRIMTSWLRRMSDVKANVVMEMPGLGWGKRNGVDVFAAGGQVFGPDGKTWEFYHADPTMIKTYKPKGDPIVWKTAAQALAADPRQAAVTTLLTAFAAPLVVFAGVKGLTFSLYSADSGTGKTSVLRTAQAVWGQPTSGMAMVNDTQLSVIRKLGFLNTIPAYWDELRSADTLKQFVQTIFTLGQGREKSRLTSAIKQQDSSTWDTLVTVASNEMLSDHIDSFIKNSDSGRLRLFEVSLPHVMNPNPAISRAFSDLEANYGHACLEWGMYLAKNRAAVAATVTRFQSEVRGSVGSGSNERFWIAFVACILAAAEHVNLSGILSIDEAKLRQWILAEFLAQQTGVKVNYVTTPDAAIKSIFSFVEAHRNRMLLVDKMYPPKGTMHNIMTPTQQLPRDQIVVLKSLDDNIIRIDHHVWKSWVTDKLGHSPTAFMKHLKPLGVTPTKVSLNAGLKNASGARVACLELDLSKAPFDKLVDQ